MLQWVILSPFIGFILNGFWYAFIQAPPGKKKASSYLTGGIATASIAFSFCLSVLLFLRLSELPVESRQLEEVLFQWIHVAPLKINFTLRVDALSSLFLLVITGVGTLIHLYSMAYMSHDESPGKFFSYLNLFCFSMLVLVLGGSFPVLFLGWEGVGLCSYLLIGYWYSDEEKAKAGKKAFIVNRIGDLGVLVGMFLIFSAFGTLDFFEIKTLLSTHSVSSFFTPAIATAIALSLFFGCTGKSAQIPLYIWLPDAMAGPTPVSALIHAATMVTSGIYLLTRLNFLFVLSPVAMQVIAWIGVSTALLAASIAIVQTDIKKILAYSTVSQLGFMFLACGVGAFDAGVFHVITHAFFKALLFLAAGSVIHGMHEEQDILKMGGLRKKMPQTFFVFLIGWLAISGIPPFSGFFSKDEILWKAFSSEQGSPYLWGVGFLTALLTSFYMTRLFSLTFLGKSRFNEHHEPHVHESPLLMIAPLMVLALLSLVGGGIGIPHFSWLEHWLEPILVSHHATVASEDGTQLEWILMALSTVGAASSLLFGLYFYRDLNFSRRVLESWKSVHRVLWNKWFVDEFYEGLFIRPIHFLSIQLWNKVDCGIIDRFVLGVGQLSLLTGQTLRMIQTGSIQVYAIAILLGLATLLGYFIYGMV